MTLMTSMNRRSVLALSGAFALSGIAMPSVALTKGEASALIDRLTQDIFTAINKRSSQAALFKDFEKIFAKYADVPLIAQKALGAPWRSATTAQKKAYVGAFKGYMARNYGKRFEEFIGASIEVTKSRKAQGGVMVDSIMTLKGQAPFEVQWHVIDGRGGIRMFNMFLEGVSVISDVRLQIGTMLDKRGGNIDALIQHLKTAG